VGPDIGSSQSSVVSIRLELSAGDFWLTAD
jgi:hypothetical protein